MSPRASNEDQMTIVNTRETKSTTGLKAASLWMAIYLLVVALARYLVSGTLEFDEAEQFLHAQFLLPGYGPQPPLFEWLLHGVFMIDGISFMGLLLFKAVQLWVVFWAVGRIFLLLTAREDLAVAASHAVFLLPILSWAAPRTLTHSLLATMFAALFLLALLSLARPRDQQEVGGAAPVTRADGRWTVLLALSAAGALLSKYSMAAVLLLYLLAALSVAQWRARLLNWRNVAAAAVAALLVAPHAWWVLNNLQAVRAPIMAKLTAAGKTAGAGVLQSDVAGFVSGMIGFIALPLLVWAYLWIWNRVRRGPAAGARPPTPWPAQLKPASLAYFGLFALFCVALVLGPGSSGFRNRWLAPFLLLLPTAIVVWASVQPRHADLLHRLVTISRSLLVIAALGLALRVPLSGWLGKPGWSNLPVAAIAHDVQEMTRPDSLVLVANMQLAGSLEMRLEDRLTFKLESSVASLLKPLSCELLLVVPQPPGEGSPDEVARLQDQAARFLKVGGVGPVEWVATRRSHQYRFSEQSLEVLYLSARSC